MWAGPQLKRVFPSWFEKRHHCGAQISQQYYTFVGEWGGFLDQITSASGVFPGEIERCLWGTLKPQSFLRTNKGHFKSFLFTGADDDEEGLYSNHYFEGIDSSGRDIRIIRVQKMCVWWSSQLLAIANNCLKERGSIAFASSLSEMVP
jgi:hypothetical protein